MEYLKLKDESFVVVDDFFDLEDEEKQTVIHLTNDKVEEINLTRDEEKHYPGRVDSVEIRLNDKFGIKHRYRNLECNHGYHYTKTRSKWTPDEIYTEAYKQAAISLGHLVKQVAGYMPNRTFVINNPSGWNIVYKVV